MKHRAWITLLAMITMPLGGGLAIAQQPPAPKATAAATAAPSASAAPAASAAPLASAAPPGRMPPGHPQVGSGSGTVVDDEQPQGGSDPRFFTPPEDTAVDDPTLPPGVLVVTIKDATRKPIPRAPIKLGILHSTVAKGDSREQRTAEADAEGSARFEGLAFGSGHSYRVSTTRGAATYALPPVGLTDRAGKRVVVHAFETSANLEDLKIAMTSIVFLSLRDDTIQVEQLVSVYNLGAVAWTADTTFDLPAGFKAFNKQEAQGEARVDEVPNQGAALRGTFQPGRHDLDFRYQIPLGSDDKQTLKIKLPPRVAQARVMMESSKTMGLAVTGFPASQRTTGRDGKRLLVTEHQATREEGGIRDIELTVSGLPTRPGRWFALAVAVIALAGGFYYFTQHRSSVIDDETRDDLLEAREALLGEIVALERAFKSGEVGPKTYARVRASLVDALGRIVSMIDQAKRSRPKTHTKVRRKAEPA